MKRGPILAAAVLGLALGVAPATQAADGHQFDACFAYVGHYYKINPKLLRAIAKQESDFNPKAVGGNSNGSRDLGIMQINSSWLPKLAKANIDQHRLLTEPCLNIAVGASILHDNIQRMGMTWEAVGAYNAVSPHKRTRYAAKIAHRLLHELRAEPMATLATGTH